MNKMDLVVVTKANLNEWGEEAPELGRQGCRSEVPQVDAFAVGGWQLAREDFLLVAN